MDKVVLPSDMDISAALTNALREVDILKISRKSLREKVFNC
jgi:hypothetical protein